MEEVAKKLTSHYTKEQIKMLKDFSLSDAEIAEKIGRSENAVYCKRWAMTKGKYRKSGVPSPPRKRSSKIVKTERPVSINEINAVKVNKIIFGNIVIDVINKTLIVNG